MFKYLKANKTAGYSGFVLYQSVCYDYDNISVWMIPGTFFDDWDNQQLTV